MRVGRTILSWLSLPLKSECVSAGGSSILDISRYRSHTKTLAIWKRGDHFRFGFSTFRFGRFYYPHRSGLGRHFSLRKLRLLRTSFPDFGHRSDILETDESREYPLFNAPPFSDFVAFLWKSAALRTFRCVKLTAREIYVAVKMVSGLPLPNRGGPPI